MKINLPTTISMNPEELALKVGTDVVKSVLDTIKECTIQREIQATQREAIRAQAETAIAQINANTSKYLLEAKQRHTERMKVIDIVQTYLINFGADKDLRELTDFCVTMLKAVHVGENTFK